MCIIIKFLKINFWFLAILVFEKIEVAKRFCAGNELVLSGYWASIDLRVLSELCSKYLAHFIEWHFFIFSPGGIYWIFRKDRCISKTDVRTEKIKTVKAFDGVYGIYIWSFFRIPLFIFSPIIWNLHFWWRIQYPSPSKLILGDSVEFFFVFLPVDSDWSKKVHNNKIFEIRFWNFWDIGLRKNCSRQDFLCM